MRKFSLAVSMFLLVNVLAFSPIAKADGITRRITFAKGKSSAVLANSVIRNDEDTYLIRAKAGQKMSVKVSSVERNAVFFIEKPGGGYLENAGEGDGHTVWKGTLPGDGEYKIIVVAYRGNASYKLSVTIK